MPYLLFTLYFIINRISLNIYITLLIIAREFIISGIRLIAAEKGFVIAASYWGKIKTVTQMIGIILTIIVLNYDLFPKVDIANSVPHFSYIIIDIGATIFIYISLILTIISLIDYIYKIVCHFKTFRTFFRRSK